MAPGPGNWQVRKHIFFLINFLPLTYLLFLLSVFFYSSVLSFFVLYHLLFVFAFLYVSILLFFVSSVPFLILLFCALFSISFPFLFLCSVPSSSYRSTSVFLKLPVVFKPVLFLNSSSRPPCKAWGWFNVISSLSVWEVHRCKWRKLCFLVKILWASTSLRKHTTIRSSRIKTIWSV
jgi:hypothetical protein